MNKSLQMMWQLHYTLYTTG